MSLPSESPSTFVLQVCDEIVASTNHMILNATAIGRCLQEMGSGVADVSVLVLDIAAVVILFLAVSVVLLNGVRLRLFSDTLAQQTKRKPHDAPRSDASYHMKQKIF